MDSQPFSILLNRVLFDPLAYLHPERIKIASEFISTATARSMANELIIAIFQLNVTLHELDNITCQWVKHWFRFPQVAYLIGCQTLRADLAWQAGLFRLPAWAHVFTRMNFQTPVSSARQPVDHQKIIQTGYSRLLSKITHLPEPLIPRFALLFHPCVDQAVPLPVVAPELFNLAVQYAQTNPHQPPC